MQLKEWNYQADGDCYCMEGLVYCDKPLDPEKQSMNIYVPAAYIRGESLTTRHGATYTAKTAPVVYITTSAAMRSAARRRSPCATAVTWRTGMCWSAPVPADGRRSMKTENRSANPRPGWSI